MSSATTPLITTTPFDITMKYINVMERAGKTTDHPLIQWWFSLCGMGLDTDDEIAWCSALMQHAPYELNLTRTASARARSWLKIGQTIAIRQGEVLEAKQEPQIGFDFIVFMRGNGPQPGPDIIDAPGHVGYFAGWKDGHRTMVRSLGGNQGNKVSIADFHVSSILRIGRMEAE